MTPGDSLFLRTGTIDVDAAVIGVSRARWGHLNSEEASIEKAIPLMEANRFDVLPIDNGSDDPIYEYFHTQHWGKWTNETVVRSQITFRDVLPAQTSVLNLIEKFVMCDRLFFFLTYEHRIVGLVSAANLNSRQVNFYLFALLCELETRLSRLIKHHLDKTLILACLKEKAQEDYQKDCEKGFENDAVQYLYLSSLLTLVHNQNLYKILGYSRKKQFKDMNSLNELRNQVMHPVRSLIHDKSSLSKLWERIEKLQDVLFRLRQVQGIN